jgi:O-methyltransferase/methyltransferase family protein
MQTDPPLDSSPATALLRVAEGFHVARALYVAAKLGLADLLREGPKSGAALADATGTHAPSLERVMRLLACEGVFAEDDSRRFALTPLSMLLQTGRGGSLCDLLVHQLGGETYEAWGELMQSVRSGVTGFDRAFGVGVWEYRAHHPEYAALFDAAMSDFSGVHIDAVLEAYPFSAFRRVADLGGGVGKLLVALLSTHPGMEGLLFDLPHVAESARERIASAGLASRCEVLGGDIFAGVPEGADAYVLSRVIHDWSDDRAYAILKNCRRAMPRHGKLLLIERILPARAKPSPVVRSLLASDLMMMVMNGGGERTEEEYRILLQAVGFAPAKITPTKTAMSVIETEPVDWREQV